MLVNTGSQLVARHAAHLWELGCTDHGGRAGWRLAEATTWAKQCMESVDDASSISLGLQPHPQIRWLVPVWSVPTFRCGTGDLGWVWHTLPPTNMDMELIPCL